MPCFVSFISGQSLTTKIEYECDLDHLLTDSEEMNQTKSETEIEWILMQARPTCDEDCVPKVLNPGENELELSDEPGGEVKSIIRRKFFATCMISKLLNLNTCFPCQLRLRVL